jgi:hypothetical protein
MLPYLASETRWVRMSAFIYTVCVEISFLACEFTLTRSVSRAKGWEYGGINTSNERGVWFKTCRCYVWWRFLHFGYGKPCKFPGKITENMWRFCAMFCVFSTSLFHQHCSRSQNLGTYFCLTSKTLWGERNFFSIKTASFFPHSWWKFPQCAYQVWRMLQEQGTRFLGDWYRVGRFVDHISPSLLLCRLKCITL